MDTSQPIRTRPRFWATVLKYGALHFLVMLLGFLLVEEAAAGCMFVTPAYFIVLVVALPILILRRIGAGAAVFLPYAVLGFPPVYYYDWMVNHTLRSVWGAVGWCLVGPLVGLIGDLTFRFLPGRMPGKWRAVAVGATIGAAIFVTTYVALGTFYKAASMDSHYRFFAQTPYYSLPWLVVNGAFAGYTAHAITARS